MVSKTVICVLAVAAVVFMAAGAEASEVRTARALLKKVNRCWQKSCCDGCDWCECGVCKGCGSGWYFKDNWCYEETCSDCPAHCDDCDCSGHCNKCSSGYYWADGYCKFQSSGRADASADADCYGFNCKTSTDTYANVGPGYSSSSSRSSASNGGYGR